MPTPFDYIPGATLLHYEPMAGAFPEVFAALKPVLGKFAGRLAVKTDTGVEYTLVTKSASPFPQHKGQPMWFGSVKLGKTYVSFHLMPIYMHPGLQKAVSPVLKRHMQGKACFNFKTEPGAEAVADLKKLTEAAVADWAGRKWL
jgi:hypothetical protein